MMQRKRIKNLTDIFDFSRTEEISGKVIPICCLKNKNFSNLDLSGLDLSSIEPEFWEGAKFHNTDFSNTGIRFNPENIEFQDMEYCEFENVDMSSFDSSCFDGAYIKGCNFRNTRIDIPLNKIRGRIIGVKLDKLYANKSEEYWNRIPIDEEFLKLNPFIKISYKKVWEVISSILLSGRIFLPNKKLEELIKRCEDILKFDDGTITKFYNIVCRNSNNLYQRLRFFQGVIESMVIDSITIEENDSFILRKLLIRECTFKEVICKVSISKLTDLNESYSKFFSDSNKFEKILFDDIDYHTWTQLQSSDVGRITFRTNLYLELGKQCNCRCSFCRNCSFEDDEKKCKYNLKVIKRNLVKLFPYLDTVFIGGGEPSLKMNAIKQLLELRANYEGLTVPNFVIITNGSIDEDELYDARFGSDDAIYVSRHAISDEDNKKILNPKLHTNMNDLKVFRYFPVDVVLSPVCVKGGLDTSEKIAEYIYEANKLGLEHIIISSLQKSASLGTTDFEYDDLYVDPIIFEQVKESLRIQKYEEKLPIYSTGGYVLNIFHKGEIKVIFKEYISKEEEEEQRKMAFKRTFDLTMSQNGDVFEDWRKEHKVDLDSLKP